MSKIIKLEKLSNIIKNLRKQHKKIVTCNGTFDILHAGHIKFLTEAKKQGGILIVGLNSDSSVRANKGPKRPIISQKNRAIMLAALECVDYVVIFPQKDPRNLLSVIKPDVHVNGGEYGYDCIEAPTVRRSGGKIHLIKKVKGLSTTSLIKSIIGAYGQQKR